MSYLKIICGVLIWAVINGLIVREVSSLVAPTVLGSLMSLVGVILFLPYLFINPWPKLNKNQTLLLMGLGLSAAVNNSFFYTALAMNDSKVSSVALIHYFASILAVLWVAFIPKFKERLDLASLIAVSLGIIGLIVMTGSTLLEHKLWLYFSLLSAVFYSFEIVFSRQSSLNEVSPYISAFTKLWFQLLIMPVVGFFLGQSFYIPGNQYVYIIFAGILLFISFILVFSGLKNVPVKHFSALGYLDRLGAVAIARFWWKESFGLNIWIGGLLILLAELPLLFRNKKRG